MELQAAWPLLALFLWAVAPGNGAPLEPDFSVCKILRLPSVLASPSGNRNLDCCRLEALMRPVPTYKTWEQYLRQSPLPRSPRVRPAAHSVAGNETYLKQLDRAYQLLKDLPPTDPRAFDQQSNFHCMYGSSGVSHQAGRADLNYLIHMNWLFFPFHRWQTFFHERILAKLVGDDSFVLPFWNWDDQRSGDGFLPNVMPHYFRDPEKYPALYHKNRDARHAPGAPPVIINLVKESVRRKTVIEDEDEARELNNEHLWSVIVNSTAGGEREPFMSYPLRAGENAPNLFNWATADVTFEGLAHTAVHFWVGDANRQYADMGVAALAVRDPLFFTHHANVDRIWNVWQGLDGRSNFEDPDWLDAAFYFYDEYGEIVRVTVAESLNSDLLGYTFQQVDNPWVTYKSLGPSYLRTGGGKADQQQRAAR